MAQRLFSAACAITVLLCWAARPDATTMQWAQAIAIGWLVAAVLSAVIGMLQYFAIDTSMLHPWINHADPGQAYGNLRQRNQFASLMTLGLAALLFLQCDVSSKRNHAWPALSGVVLVLLALGNAASSSRTGALQWTALLALAWIWSGARTTMLRWALAAWFGYLLATLTLPTLLEWVTGIRGSNALERFQEHVGCSSRSVLWANVLDLIAAKPWLGWGWGELKFAHFIFPYTGERFCELLDNAHNLPLHLAVTLGLPLALLLCATLLLALWRARLWRAHDTRQHLAWSVLTAIGIHSLLEYPLWYGPFQLSTGLALYLLWRTSKHRKESPAGRSAAVQAMGTALAGVALSALLYATWDYRRVSQLYITPTNRLEAYREDTFEKVHDSWLFHGEVQFAYVTTTVATPANAVALYAAGLQTLHFSPEPRVISAVLSSAQLLGDNNAAVARIAERARVIHQINP
jgi:O-antigen ligase